MQFTTDRSTRMYETPYALTVTDTICTGIAAGKERGFETALLDSLAIMNNADMCHRDVQRCYHRQAKPTSRICELGDDYIPCSGGPIR